MARVAARGAVDAGVAVRQRRVRAVGRAQRRVSSIPAVATRAILVRPTSSARRPIRDAGRIEASIEESARANSVPSAKRSAGRGANARVSAVSTPVGTSGRIRPIGGGASVNRRSSGPPDEASSVPIGSSIR